MFSGTPCQCHALASFLNKPYDSLYIAEVLCHGVPSPVVWQNYLRYRMKKANTEKYPIECIFRSKDSCEKAKWGDEYVTIRFEHEKEPYRASAMHDPYMMLFCRADVILNDSCYECRYRGLVARDYADISTADFWGIDKLNPSFCDDKGISLVLLHSQKGVFLFDSIKAHLIFTETDAKKALPLNGSIVKPTKRRGDRRVLRALIDPRKNFGRIYYTYLPIIYLRKVVKRLKKIIGKGKNE
ncbi:MAG: Coenzyme F420 hydrogenase/dehydrogenase, beta subunit C-terminal domain [Bacteroides sp.]|nr:Coenzyme F420 hydrogenase/dehydrogenase, beta subunit C-terminal domain [Eubacterium sp.]MCM1419061.1 Coenzyme F420 hydrogenase/dehydrogenase, beta subunit C-terminal domain [Roseburia sp.]MCM1461752.1 Coenzyme F420 hydrogenase/dehydrogenase, beta subunit C-terminal domain [Bacteroides sp.]